MENKKFIGIVLLACLVASGLTMNFLGCALKFSTINNDNWLLILSIVCYILLPIPLYFASSSTDNYSSNNPLRAFFLFLFGFIFAASYAIPLVLAHSQIVAIESMGLTLGGCTVVYLSFLLYGYFYGSSNDYDP
eukprot:TRINITY_DN3559_c0_g4_i1.p1 TRINITY_DN3559_c0_g4~~TRINITY_DN3559_c0_g4_i1.p1  ORF type:complete len:134 (+),score=37.76 TRINITY_DN3559_c0_g4_i1:50-451(+)